MVLHVVWSPWSIADAAGKCSMRAAMVLCLASCSVILGVPLGVLSVAVAEPYRDLTHYFSSMVVPSLALIGIAAVPSLIGTLLLYGLASLLFVRSTKRDVIVRVLFLVPMTFVIPVVLWSVFFGLAYAQAWSFGLYGSGKPPWMMSPVIAFLGSSSLLMLMIVLVLVTCAVGLVRIPRVLSSLVMPICRRCGYNLTGNVSGVCPECGSPVAEEDRNGWAQHGISHFIVWKVRRYRFLVITGFAMAFAALVWWAIPQSIKDSLLDQSSLTLYGHRGVVRCVAFSPDGSQIVSGGGSPDQTIRVWDASTGEEANQLGGHAGGVKSLAFGPKGQRIVSGGMNGTVKVWDVVTGQEEFSIAGHTGWTNVAISQDGGRIASAASDKVVKIWDAANGDEILTLYGHNTNLHCVAFGPDGTKVASGASDDTVKVWDACSGAELMTLSGCGGAVKSVSFSSDGQRIVAAGWGGVIRVWDAVTGEVALTISLGSRSASMKAMIEAVVFSPDLKWIVSGGLDGRIRVWDAATGEHVRYLRGHVGGVESLAFSSDGNRLVSASWDETIKVWDFEVRE